MAKITKPGQVLGYVTGFFKRIGLHLIAFVSGLAISGASFPQTFCAYLGIICLIPGGFTLSQNRFLFPAVISVGQFLLTWLWGGIPISISLFWAGMQSWLLHSLIKRFRMSWDWAALPVLLIGFALSHDLYRFPVAFFFFCTLCGWGSYALTTLQQNRRRLNRALFKLLSTLEPALKLNSYPKTFDAQFRLLQEHSGSFAALGVFRKNRFCELLLPKLEEVAPALEQAVKWPEERFKEREANFLLASLDELNKLYGDLLNQEKARLGYLPPARGALTGKNGKSEPADEFGEYRTSANQLLGKKSKLPPELQRHITALYLSTESIITCMRDDPDDRGPGGRFLNRYLPAAHKVVDEYIRLGAEGQSHDTIKEVLARSENLLARMAVAFHEEHGNLLRNDTMRFSADLNVLDKLLKMDGR